ncbi:MAG TPA: aspartate dehydrogenase [Burkholderiaceae bacterium]|nr:aspartate dehydrogenase [Burkholderiaceae bacterium]
MNLLSEQRSIEGQPGRQGGPQPTLTVGIAGFGAIGKKVAQALDGGVPGLRLVAVSARDMARAEAAVRGFRVPVPLVPVESLGEMADVVVECAPAEIFMRIAEPTLRRGRTLVVVSVGAVLQNPQIEALAREHGGRVLVATGALLALDAMQAAREGEIHSVRMVTRKPPAGLAGAPYLVANGIDLTDLRAPLKVFEGSARKAVQGFPANVNVAAALGLAGIGVDRTTIEIWADPGVDRNMHVIHVEADSASFSMSIANVPSENPKTGRITPLSVIATLRKMGSPLQIGT